MLNIFIILIGKLFSFISVSLNLGGGSTWPGHIALMLNKNFIKDLINNQKTNGNRLKTILIAGTNGKTTTAKLISTILKANGNKVFQNNAGANLLNGIASSLLLHSSLTPGVEGAKTPGVNYDYAIFEVDENSLPLILNELTPDYIILMNLFRDQLDRYGEIDTIAKKWKKSLESLSGSTTLILNADDPQIASLDLLPCHPEFSRPEQSRSVSGSRFKTYYFGLNSQLSKPGLEINEQTGFVASDSTYCPNCSSKLKYKSIYFSHLGDWECSKCKLKHPKTDLTETSYYPIPGTYNKYNIHAAVLFAKISNINNEKVEQSLHKFKPAFGRQEEIEIDNKKVKILLSKNPTSLNQSLETIISLGANSNPPPRWNVLLVLNDRIPDGRDVSWIWDVNFEELLKNTNNITVSGDRAYDMALRLKYAFQSRISPLRSSSFEGQAKTMKQWSNLTIEEDLKKAIKISLEKTQKNETLYILPTYSAMLEVRKILTGRKIL